MADPFPPRQRGGGVAGPLVVSRRNPRYLAVPSSDGVAQRCIYLTGSHFNNNFQDGLGPGPDCAATPEAIDYRAYLTRLKDLGHNFVRLWRWEQFRSYLPGADVHLCMTPQPWPRTGPGAATDGKPRFDLSTFDATYFNRLRDRVTAAGDQGIYVSVMLFEGFGLHMTSSPDNVGGHPFHAENNVNGVGIASIVDYQVLPLDPKVQALQENYVRKVIDILYDLPNVLWEIANESSGMVADSVPMPDGSTIDTPIGDSTDWQYWLIDVVKRYEADQGFEAHPIGMTFQHPVADQTKANDPLFASPADWVSPGYDDQVSITAGGDEASSSRWLGDPPANDGTKVVLSDTDHYSPLHSEALWAWKTFLRGHNPILYDLAFFDDAESAAPDADDPPSAEPTRHAMGDTRRFAERVDLAEMTPAQALTSTGYALVHPGHEYLVLDPRDAPEPFDVTLEPATYLVEWYGVASREAVTADPVTVERAGGVTFRSPAEAGQPAVLYLRKMNSKGSD